MKSSNEHRQSSFKGKGEKSPLAICCTFLAQPSINPETGKPLVYNSSFYQTLIQFFSNLLIEYLWLARSLLPIYFYLIPANS